MATVLNILLEITIYSVILYLAILLFKKVFHKHISAILNYAVWGLLILRLLIPVTIDSGLHFFVIPEATTQVAQTEFNSTDESMTVQEELDTLALDQYATQSVANENAVGRAPNNAVNDNDVDVSKPASWKLSWQTVLVLLWTTGVFGSLIYMTVLWLQLHWNIKRHRIRPPEYVLKLVETCKKDLGINAGIDVSIQSWLTTPALCASLKPKLLLPKSMLDKMGRQQIEFGIRHELTHYRRKDHLTHLLLVFLRCVYWFNPIVWLAARQIKTDMETACDASVTSSLGNKDRTRYIRTMIDLSGDMDAQYILGMGLGNERRSMEKRVKGIFMKKKTKPSVRMVAILLACVMAMVCFTTACQPTPESEAVVGKGDGALMDKINETNLSTPDSSANAIIKVWKETFNSKDGKVNFVVDANVEIPDVNNYPVLGVKPGDFSSEQIKAAATALLDGADFYSGKDLLTKSIIQDRIVQFQKSINEYKSQNKDGMYDYSISELEDAIKRYQEQYDSATDELPHNPPVYEFIDGMVNIYSDMNGNGIRTLDVSDSGLYSNLTYITNRNYVITNDTIEIGKNVNNNLSYSDAKAVADKYLNAMGVDYMDVSYVRVGRQVIGDQSSNGEFSVVVNDGDTSTNDTGNDDTKYNESIDPCYVFYYTRTINGVLTTYVNRHNGTSVTGVDGAETYREPWKQEYIEIFVDKDGIAQLNWNSPTDFVCFESENVSILSLEDAKSLAKEKLQIMYNDYFHGQNVVVYINEVKLGMTRIAVKGNDNQYMFVPTWDFFGYYTQDTLSEKQQVSEKNAYTMLTINAVDSSVIDRGLEY